MRRLGQRLVRRAIFSKLRGIDADQPNLAAIDENQAVAVEHVPDRYCFIGSYGRRGYET